VTDTKLTFATTLGVDLHTKFCINLVASFRVETGPDPYSPI